MSATKVSPELLEAMWGIAAAQGKESALEVGHPTKDVLRVDGKTVAWSAKPQARGVGMSGDMDRSHALVTLALDDPAGTLAALRDAEASMLVRGNAITSRIAKLIEQIEAQV